MWVGPEDLGGVLDEREVALHNVRSALESALQSVAAVRLSLDDAEELLAKLRVSAAIAIEEVDIWLGN